MIQDIFGALQNNLERKRPSAGETKILFEYFFVSQMGGNDSDVKRMTQKNL